MSDLLDDEWRTEFIAACERAKASLRKAIEACDRAAAECRTAATEREALRMRHLFGETGEGE